MKRQFTCALFMSWGLMQCPLTAAEVFTDPTLVNFFRHANVPGGATLNQVTAAWTDISAGGGIGYPAFRAIDSGTHATQLNFGSQSASNAGALQFTMPAVAPVAKFVHRYTLGHRPTQYRILGSTTGFTGMTELVPWTNLTGSSATNLLGSSANVQYVRYEFLGTQDTQFMLLSEIQAFAAAATTIRFDEGYNLFSERPATGGPGPAPLGAPYITGSWIDNPNQALDLNTDTYLRGAGTSGTNSFIVPLNGLYGLHGAAVGFYHGQVWGGGITVDVTTDATITGSNNWTQVYTQASSLDSSFLSFNGIHQARFVRVSTPAVGSGGALAEFELFVPEPATAVVTALLGCAMAVRRRR